MGKEVRMKKNMAVLSIAIALSASSVSANTFIDTYLSPTTYVTDNFTGIAQTFVAPADNVLEGFTFGIEPRSVNGNLNFSIYEWVGQGPSGTALYSVTIDWPAVTSDIHVSGINLILATGSLYAAVIDLQEYNLNSVYYVGGNPYAGGNGFWTHDMTTWLGFPEYDLRFKAEFTTNMPDPDPDPPEPEPSFIPIFIDIKPGDYPNSLNLKAKGLVPVAILTGAGFDASTVDPNTVTFADASPRKWKMTDVDNDGDMDMLLHFETQDLNIGADSTEATLTGICDDGTDIVGADSVNIVPKERKNHLNHNKHWRGRADKGHTFFNHTTCHSPHLTNRACMIR